MLPSCQAALMLVWQLGTHFKCAMLPSCSRGTAPLALAQVWRELLPLRGGVALAGARGRLAILRAAGRGDSHPSRLRAGAARVGLPNRAHKGGIYGAWGGAAGGFRTLLIGEKVNLVNLVNLIPEIFLAQNLYMTFPTKVHQVHQVHPTRLTLACLPTPRRARRRWAARCALGCARRTGVETVRSITHQGKRWRRR